MDVNGRIAIVNGASSGIGKALSAELAKRGATIVLCARREDKLKRTFEEIIRYAPDSIYRVCDCTDNDQVIETVNTVHETFGRIDMMLNIAGLFEPKLVKDATWEDYYRDMNVCFFGATRFNHEVLPIMLKQNRGIILNTSSINEQLHPPGISAYSATKAAVYAYSDSLYKEVRFQGIHVGVIQPVLVKTEMTEGQQHTRPVHHLSREIAEGSFENYRDMISYLKIQDPEASAKEIIKKGIEKERFEIYTGSPPIVSVFGIMMKTCPGLSRGSFSLVMSRLMNTEPAQLKTSKLKAAENKKSASRGGSPFMNRMLALSNPVGHLFRELFVIMDESMNKFIYRIGKFLLE